MSSCTKEVAVRIPKDGSEYFSTYAEGFFLGESFENDDVHIHLDASKAVILYYVFGKKITGRKNILREIFVCSSPENFSGKHAFSFPNVEGRLSIFFSLSGRAADKFKRRMEFFSLSSKGEVYSLPLLFFWKLGALCRMSLDNRFTLKHLWNQFSLSALSEVDWKSVNDAKKSEKKEAENGI